ACFAERLPMKLHEEEERLWQSPDFSNYPQSVEAFGEAISQNGLVRATERYKKSIIFPYFCHSNLMIDRLFSREYPVYRMFTGDCVLLADYHHLPTVL
ncbi:MAG: hypothetical protein AAFP02_19450, partial [Bacteroidota bacterium]